MSYEDHYTTNKMLSISLYCVYCVCTTFLCNPFLVYVYHFYFLAKSLFVCVCVCVCYLEF